MSEDHPRSIGARLRRLLTHRHLPIGLALLSVTLCLPSLKLGFILDDHYHRVMIQGHEQLGEKHSPTDLFSFGDASTSPSSTVPWWVNGEIEFRFFRPLASLSHGFDHWLWPQSTALMHAQSLLWLGLLVWAAAYFFRSLMVTDTSGVAGLAALFFAVDDAHAAPAMWLANRSALMALFFGLLCLIAHHRWRRDGWRLGAIAAPIALALAMLSAESGMAAGAYLLAYALFLDRGRFASRLASLIPCTMVGILWVVIYKVGGYGASASSLYVDPSSEPLRFLRAVLGRVPKLLLGQVGFPPADLFAYLSQPVAAQATIVAAAIVTILALVLMPLLRHEPVARFFAFGMALSVLPICATLPSNRLLGYVSIGGSFLIALLLVRAWQSAGRRHGVKGEAVSDETVNYETSRGWRYSSRLITPFLLFSHLIFGPLFLLGAAASFERVDRVLTGPGATLPSDESVREQNVVLVNAPNSYLAALLPVSQAAEGRTLPREILTLATSIYEIEIKRLDARTLRLRPRGGFLMPAGTVPAGRNAPPFSVYYFLQTADDLFWDGLPFQVGDRIRRHRVDIHIAAITDDGRPAEVIFTFDSALEETTWRWLRYEELKGLVPWQPPAIGESQTFEALGPRRRDSPG